jgi:predicted aspartyl protease
MQHLVSCRIALATMAAALAAGPAGSQSTGTSVQGSGAEKPDTIQLEQEYQQRLTVPIRIDGKGPYPFVVDTGAERTVISNELARHLELEPGRPVLLHSMSGAVNVSTALIPQLQVSRRRVSDIRAPMLLERNIRASGILGIDALQSQRVDFDFGNQRMKVTPSRGTPARYFDDAIVVTARSRYGRLIMTDAELNGEKVTVVLDTGSSVSVGNEALRQRLAQKGKLGTTTRIELISVTGGTVFADQTILKKMRLGEIRLQEMPIAFAQVHPFDQLKLNDRPAMLLGMDVLSLFSRISVDFATRKVHFLLPDLSMRPDVQMADAAKTDVPQELAFAADRRFR